MIRGGSLLFCVFAAVMAGCSSSQPSEKFLNEAMRIIVNVNPNISGGVETETLKMKPANLYGIFDRDVRKKEWKKEHENSWILVVKGRDPVNKTATTFEFTLVLVPQYDNDVVVKTIKVNGRTFSSIEVADMMRYLDQGFAAQR